MKPIRVAVIGVGSMGSIHASAYQKLPDAELVGVTDIDSSLARKVADDLGVRAYHNTRELVSDARLEAISICTNDEAHVDPTVAALRAGKHVLLEKPIATTLEDADTILEAVAESSKVFLVGHILRFEPRYREAKRAIDAGSIGQVISVFARRLNALSSQNILKGRVSVLSFLGVHDFDLCHWIAQAPPARVYCEQRRGLQTGLGYDTEDQTYTLIRFANDVIACVEAGWVLPDTHPRKGDFRMEVIGTQGVVNVDLMSQGVSIADEQGYRFLTFGHGVEYELAHYLRSVRAEEVPGITGQEARVALELSLAAQQAARTGQVVTL